MPKNILTILQYLEQFKERCWYEFQLVSHNDVRWGEFSFDKFDWNFVIQENFKNVSGQANIYKSNFR